jgi:trimethylamine--corrinoid protein Co-methyltransferase
MPVTLQLLAVEEVEQIHQAGLRILDEIGVAIEDEEIVGLLSAHGCKTAGLRVRIPPALVEQLLTQVPGRVTLYDRQGAVACCLGDGRARVQPVGGTPFVLDLDTGEQRLARQADLVDLVRLMDGLDNITVATTPTDGSGVLQSLAGFATALLYSRKPVSAPGPKSAAEVRWFARLVAAACEQGELAAKPSFVVSILPASPLSFPHGTAEAAAEAARLGVPISVVPLPVLGITAPLTLAGALAQQHAENLATVAIAQVVRPGTPMVYHGRLSVGNMRSGASLWGLLEIGLTGAAAVTLARRCGLPANVYGLATSAKTPDVQSGLERMANALLPLLAGADVLGGAGSLANIMVASPLQLIVDDELIAEALRVQAGISVADEPFPLEVIRAVAGSQDITFMGEAHTVRLLRATGQWLGAISDRSPCGEVRPNMLELARAKAHAILARAGTELAVSPLAQRNTESVLAAAAVELGA